MSSSKKKPEGYSGVPRRGNPRTDKERKKRHGQGKLPPRGTGKLEALVKEGNSQIGYFWIGFEKKALSKDLLSRAAIKAENLRRKASLSLRSQPKGAKGLLAKLTGKDKSKSLAAEVAKRKKQARKFKVERDATRYLDTAAYNKSRPRGKLSKVQHKVMPDLRDDVNKAIAKKGKYKKAKA